MAPLTVATILPFILLLPSLILAQSSANPCVSKCSPVSSFCNGDETGPALDDCECDTYAVNGQLISCVKACPETEVARYAGLVPEKCREQLFPGVAAVAPASTSSGGSATVTMTTTGSMTRETESSSTTAQSAAATATTGSDSGSAGVRNALVWPVSAAVVGGVLAAFALL